MDVTGCTAAVFVGFVYLCLKIRVISTNETSDCKSNCSQPTITTTTSSSSLSSSTTTATGQSEIENTTDISQPTITTTTTSSSSTTTKPGPGLPVYLVAAVCVVVLVAIVFAFGYFILKRHGKPIKYDVSKEKERYDLITMESIPKIGGASKLLGDDLIVGREEGEENEGEEPYDHLNINGTKSNVTVDEFASKNIYDHLGKKDNDYDTTDLSTIHRRPIDKPYDRAYFPQTPK